MKKIQPKNFLSQFDVVKELRFYETLNTNDIVRLIEPYYKGNINQEKQKKILSQFYYLLGVEATNVSFLIALDELIIMQVIESKNKKIKKIDRRRGLDGRLRKIEVKDKDAMWKNLAKNNGYDWEMVGELNKKYDFYNVNFSNEIQVVSKNKGRSGGKYLSEIIQWQTA
jgi:hypothetical protein